MNRQADEDLPFCRMNASRQLKPNNKLSIAVHRGISIKVLLLFVILLTAMPASAEEEQDP